MNPVLLVYLAGVFAVIAYSAYIDADDPLPLVFLAVVWPIAFAFLAPIAFGYAVRAIVKMKAK